MGYYLFYLFDEGIGEVACEVVNVENFLKRTESTIGHVTQCVFDGLWNLKEADLSIYEGLDCDFVCSVESGGGTPASFEGFAGKAQAGKTFLVRWMEVKLERLGEVESLKDAFFPDRVKKGILNGEGHIGGGELREYGSIHVFNHGMDDTLWVDDNIDLFRIYSE